MLPGRSPIHWLRLNRWTYVGVQDEAVVAVAYWEPAGPAMAVDTSQPGAPAEPVISDAGYVLIRVDDPRGKGFAWGEEPANDDWPEELLWRAGRLFREWALHPHGIEEP